MGVSFKFKSFTPGGQAISLEESVEKFGLVRALDPSGFQWVVPRTLCPATLPSQGFKLHISAALSTSASTLCRVGPFLLQHQIAFKAVGDSKCLKQLNMGLNGYSQVGKFITIYPSSDAQALWLVEKLIGLTAELEGPRIPSDVCLYPGSVIHYRYGAFAAPSDPSKETTLEKPDGAVVEDERSPLQPIPVWQPDLIGRYVREKHPHLQSKQPLRDFIILKSLRQRAKGGTYLALALSRHADGSGKSSMVVLKEGRAHGEQSKNGSDARDKLRWQAYLLAHLQDSKVTPHCMGLQEFPTITLLVMELVGNRSLKEMIESEQISSATSRRNLAVSITRSLIKVHAKGFRHLDFAPDNVRLGPDGGVYIVDFEFSFWSDFPSSSSLSSRGKSRSSEGAVPAHSRRSSKANTI